MQKNLIQLKLELYPNLLETNSTINAWNAYESFPISHITEHEKNLISDIIALEQTFKITESGNNYDLLLDTYESYVLKFLTGLDTPVYLYYSEHKKQVKNRVRSYKGILTKDIKKETCFQIEVPMKENYTTIASIIKITSENILHCIDYYLDSQVSFMVISNRQNIFSNDFVQSITINMMNHHGRNILNFIKLITAFCPLGDIIIRNGGDGGMHERSFQIFCEKSEKLSTLSYINSI